MTYDNKNRGSIWKNEKKEKDTHPDFTGNYTDADGRDYWVSAWKRKEGAAEKAPALTFSLKPKDQARASVPAAKTDGARVTPRRSAREETDDFIPFGAEFR